MARSNNATAGNYLSNGAAAVTAAPCTMAAWFNPVNVTEDHILISCSQIGAASNWFFLAANGFTAGDPVAASTNSSGSEALALTTTSFVANTWQHACGVFTSATSRAAYLNGGGVGTNATNLTPTGINRTYVGRLSGPDGSLYGSLNAAVAEAAIWSAALSADEVLQLSKGLSPLLIRPASLVCYWPIYGRISPEPDYGDGFPLTITGTMSQAAHTRVFMPSSLQIGVSAQSGAITGTASLVFTPAAALSGAGALAGTANLTFTPSALLTGAGALAGLSALAFTPVGAGTGVGALAGTAILSFAPVGSLKGAGALSGVSALAITPTATVTGAGALTGASALTFAPVASLKGAGALAGTTTLTFTPSAALTAPGSLTGSASVQFAPVASLTGTGQLIGSSALVFAPTAQLKGAGALIGNGAFSFTLAATFGIFLTGSAQVSFSVSGTLRATGALSGTIPLALGASGSLASLVNGSLLGSAALTFLGLGVLSGHRIVATPRSRTVVAGRESRSAVLPAQRRVAIQTRSRRTVH